MITSQDLAEFEADLDQIQIDVNGKFNYFTGSGVGSYRSGWKPVSGREFFENATKARRTAKMYLEAADAMDFLLTAEINKLRQREADAAIGVVTEFLSKGG